MKNRLLLFLVVLCLPCATLAHAADKAVKAERIERPGLPNFYRVSPHLYRGAQPEDAGFDQLKKLGIKTVLNLRSFHSDRRETRKAGLGYEHLYMKAWHPEDEEIVHFLKLMADRDNTPVFIHCQHGADRTGLMVAIYRIAACGWSRDQAIAEMTQESFGFHSIWNHLIDFVRTVDIETLKKKARISARPLDC